MRWTAAWLLALAVHLAVVGVVWLCCRGATRRLEVVRDTVELAVLEAEAEPARERPSLTITSTSTITSDTITGAVTFTSTSTITGAITSTVA